MEAAIIAAAGMQAAGSIMAGREQARAAAFEQQQLRAREQIQRTAAAQAEARRREELVSSLQAIQAMRAGQGLAAGGPTGTAILDVVRRTQERDIRTERLNLLSEADQSRIGAGLAGRRASSAMVQGFLKAGQAVASGISRLPQS